MEHLPEESDRGMLSVVLSLVFRILSKEIKQGKMWIFGKKKTDLKYFIIEINEKPISTFHFHSYTLYMYMYKIKP